MWLASLPTPAILDVYSLSVEFSNADIWRYFVFSFLVNVTYKKFVQFLPLSSPHFWVISKLMPVLVVNQSVEFHCVSLTR